MGITGRLENWSWDPIFRVIWGHLYDDVHRRWGDGQYIHTSNVTSHDRSNTVEGVIISTLNSTYLLGRPGIENVN